MKMIRRVNTQTDPSGCDGELRIRRADWVTLQSRPDMKDGGQIIWQDLMTALGHTSTLSTKHRAPNNAQTQAFCWLGSARIHHLAISSANFLSPKHLRELCSMATAAGITTWLLYDIEPCDERLAVLSQLDPYVCDVVEFLAARTTSPEEASASTHAESPRVPDSHFLEFLERAIESVQREPLKQELQEKMAALFHQGREKMLRAIAERTAIGEMQVALTLHEITGQTIDVDEVICLVKGAQAGAFLGGWNLKVDITRWLQRGKISSLSVALDKDDWNALSRMQNPCVAAAIALSILGVSSDDMSSVAIEAVRNHASTISFHGANISVPPQAQELLQAQLLYRNLVGTSQSPYLVQGPKEAVVTPRWAGEVMRTATRETGVAIRGWDASRRSTDASPWTLRSGISVMRFVS